VNSLVAEGQLRPINPATLAPVGAVPVTLDVAPFVAGALAAQEEWRRSAFAGRRELLDRVSRVLLARKDEIAATITAETGKPIVEAYTTELLLGIEQLAWLARNVEHVLAPERVRHGIPYLAHKRAHVVYEPVGVVGVISPWNFPFAIPLTQTASAVAAGNAVVLKPSELTPLSGALVADVFAAAGAPKGLVSVVQGAGETGAALVEAPGVAKLIFTGSAATGRKLAAAAGALLRPITLELGGKDPMLVLHDADLDRAVEGAAWGSFANCGQVCVGIERIYVARDLHARFVDALALRARKLRIGPGDDPDTDLGPLITEQHRSNVEDLVAEALERGAEAVTGARRPDVGLPGWFYEPTVLVGGDPEARIEREEVFGPVVTVQPFDHEAEAVSLANTTSFGLGASVWTRDVRRAKVLASRMEAGMVWTNDLGYSYGAGPAPWGGRKESGLGRTHSKHGLYDVSHVKLVDSDRGRVAVPWWYPYGPRALDGFRGVLEVLHGDRKLRALWTHRRGLAHLARRYVRR
jgi:succinate-semialdehyde dehydrogenase/glutarate-semialdehyde dehydrogenase